MTEAGSPSDACRVGLRLRAWTGRGVICSRSLHTISTRKSAIKPHSGLRRDFRPDYARRSVTLSVGTPLPPYGIAYRRGYGFFVQGLFNKSFCSPMCGGSHATMRQEANRCVFLLFLAVLKVLLSVFRIKLTDLWGNLGILTLKTHRFGS
jgi:hypothetical protein